MIENAWDKGYSPNAETKHKTNAKRGWNYYKVGVAVKTGNAYSTYNGKLNIRLDEDGNDYVYYITEINKASDFHPSRVIKESDTSSGNSISSSQKKSSTNSGNNEVRHALDVDSGEIAQKAEKYFGTTRRFDLAGYLDVNGKLLDFSDGQKYRVQDHREISEILDLPEDAGYSDGLIQFMGMGNIRLNPYGIDIAVKPNEAQKDKLYDFFESLDGEVTVDFSTPSKGDTVGSADYSEGTSPRRIINDIESYFDTGEVPEGTDDGNVYYSLNISPDEQTEIQNEVDELQKELDEWDGRKSGQFRVGSTPKILQNEVGIPSADIEIDKSKVKKIFADHPEMRKLLPQIPRILHDPVIVLDSKTVDGAYVIYGNVFDGNKPVLVSLLVNPTNRRGVTLDVHKVSSTYAKDNAQRQLNESNVRYINPDKEITTNWERLTRLQLPFVPPTISGSFNEIIPHTQKKSSTNSGENDIRHALNIEDGFNDWISVSTMSDEEFYKEYGGFLDDDTAAGVYMQSAKNLSDSMKTMSGLLQAANETLKGARVDDTVILKLAKKIKAEYGSNMSANQISERLSMVFDYLQNSEKVDYEDMVKILQEVSDDIINESTQIDTSAWDEMREVLKERSFTLGEYQKDEVRNDYGNIKNFRQQYFGILDVARDGSGISSLDSQWGEIADALGLDRDIPDTAQIAALTEYIESVRPVAENIYGESKEEYAYDLAMRIMTDYYKAAADNMVDIRVERAISNGEAGESAKESLKKYRKKMMSEVNTFRKATKEAYEKNFSSAEAQIAAQQESIKDLNTYIKRQNNIITTLDGEKRILNDRLASERELNKRLSRRQRDYAKRKAYNKLAVKQYRDMQQIKAEKEKITKIGAQFYRMLNKPTDKQHILDGMQKPIAEFLLGIDFISDRAKTGSESTIRWQEKFRALEDWVHKAIEGKVEGEASGLQYVIDPELEDHMREFISRNRDTNKVSSLSATELHELYSIMRSLQSAIKRSNERFMDRRGQKISTVSNNTIEKLAKVKDKKTLLPGKLGRDMDSFLNASSIDARTFFKEAEAMPIYEGLHEGMNIRTRDIKEAGEYMEDVLKGIKSKTLDAWRKDTHKLELRDGTLEISTAQAMSLYELLKREQAREHILRGGVRPTIKEKDKSRTRQIEPVQINELEIGKIEELLTPEQIRIADAMQSYMSHEVADKGNETSMRMYGYKKFNEENYFPIKTDKNTTNTNDRTKENNSSMTGILHMGMTKNTVDNANNAIIADDIFNVFTEHIADMATYHGMAMPIADAMRWFNYDEIFLNNDIGEIKGKRQDVSVKKQLERVRGSDAQNFFVALMEDLNGMSNTATDANKAELFAGAYKAAAIGANVRVAIQQPTSYFRAAMEMNPKYLAQALTSAPMAEKWANKAQENSMLAWWKSQGFYETSMGKSLEQMILGQSSIVENIKDYSSILAQKGDDWTWGILYRAAELEVSETTDLKYDSPEYKEAVVRRFEDIVDTTQVVDTQLHRTQIMRSKDGLVKTMSAFMSEPMKYYNMLHRAYTEAIREKNAKPVVRALSVYLLTNIATSAAAALIDALRNDDDDTPWEERWLEAFKDNAWDNINPFHMLPIVSDVFDLAWDGLRNSNPFLSSNSNMNIAAVSSLVTAVKEIEKITNGDKEADYNTVAKITRAIGQFTGIPAYNMLREVRTVHDNMNNLIPQTGDNWYKPSGESTTTSEYSGVYDAIANGGDISQEVESVIQKKVDSGKELSDAQSAVRGTITRKYKQEFIDAYNSGSGYADLKVSISQAYQATGMTKEEADEKVDSFLE